MDPLATALAQLRRSFERFVPLPDAVWDDVRRPWRLCPTARGEILTREGEVENTFALVVEGVQRIYFTGAQGDAHTVAFAYPPDYSGIPDSFFLRTPSAYTLEATTDGQVLAVHYDEFAALMSQHRELDQWAWRLFAAAAAGRAKREREHTALSAEERYERLLRESPHLLQLVPLKQIASYLGMSPETLSRIRAAS